MHIEMSGEKAANLFDDYIYEAQRRSRSRRKSRLARRENFPLYGKGYMKETFIICSRLRHLEEHYDAAIVSSLGCNRIAASRNI